MPPTSSRARDIIRSSTAPLDLAIVDLKLEGSAEEGIELIGIIKKTPHRHKLRPILITAYPDPGNRARALKTGVDEYISKLGNSETKELQEAVLRLV